MGGGDYTWEATVDKNANACSLVQHQKTKEIGQAGVNHKNCRSRGFTSKLQISCLMGF